MNETQVVSYSITDSEIAKMSDLYSTLAISASVTLYSTTCVSGILALLFSFFVCFINAVVARGHV